MIGSNYFFIKIKRKYSNCNSLLRSTLSFYIITYTDDNKIKLILINTYIECIAKKVISPSNFPFEFNSNIKISYIYKTKNRLK